MRHTSENRQAQSRLEREEKSNVFQLSRLSVGKSLQTGERAPTNYLWDSLHSMIPRCEVVGSLGKVGVGKFCMTVCPNAFLNLPT